VALTGCVTYFPGRRRQGATQARCSCRHVRASWYRDTSAASAPEVRRCRSRCTGSERGARCASPRRQTEPPAADNRMLNRYEKADIVKTAFCCKYTKRRREKCRKLVTADTAEVPRYNIRTRGGSEHSSSEDENREVLMQYI